MEVIRASCAFPGLFEPVEIGTRYSRRTAAWWRGCRLAARASGSALHGNTAANIVIGVSVGMHDGYRGAPTQYFSSGQPRGQRRAETSGGNLGTPRQTWCCAPKCSRWRGTISIAPRKPSTLVQRRRGALCRVFVNYWKTRSCWKTRRLFRSPPRYLGPTCGWPRWRNDADFGSFFLHLRHDPDLARMRRESRCFLLPYW